MAIVDQLVQALQEESDAVDDLVANLPDEVWSTATPAEGWSIAHQIGHLHWTDRVSLLSIVDEAGFRELVVSAMTDPTGFVDVATDTEAARPPAELLADWRKTRAKLAGALLAVEDGRKLTWFGPPMSAASMATARLMESWAHGLDIADALGAPHAVGDRIKNVVHLGIRTRNFAYLVNGLEAPAEEFRFEITAPSGELWTWGPEDATNIVRGPAVDFCELITQRRHIADLALEVFGVDAAKWASIAQAFAGPPGGGREAAGTTHQTGGAHA